MPAALLLTLPLVDRFSASIFYEVAGILLLFGTVAWGRVVTSERTPARPSRLGSSAGVPD